MTLGQMLAQTADRLPNKTAIRFRDQETTYADFDKRANQVANGLIALGVQPGDRVALLIHNLPLFMEAYYGILKAGAAVVPMNVLYKPAEIEYIVKDSGAKALLTLAPFAPQALQAAANAPELQNVIVASPEEMPGAVLWRDAFGQASEAAPNVAVGDQDIAVIPYTSGTTGRPKGAMLTHRNLIANCEQCEHVERIKPQEDDVIWIALPLFHIYAMNVGMNLTVKAGGTMALIERFEPASALESIQTNKCTILYGAPPMFVAWAQMPNIRDYDLSSVRYIASGAAALPVKHHGAVRGHGWRADQRGLWPDRGVARGDDQRGWPGHQAGHGRQADSWRRGEDCGRRRWGGAPGEMGELICRGENIMKGYWKQPEATAEALRDGWLYTGDLATVDGDGYISIVDRKKDMIIVSGYNVYPREVEEVLFKHPAVADASVIGVPDDYQGESVMAVVVLKPDQTATEQEIIDYCRNEIAVFKCPRKVVFRDALPKNNTGKVLRRELRESVAQGA